LDLLAERGTYLDAAGRDQMRDLSAGMPEFFKQTLYERHGKNALAGAITNLFTGGIGSLLMGDWAIGSVLTLGGLGTLTASALMITGMPMSSELRNVIAYAGIGISVAGVGWPFIYAGGKNARLKAALSLD